MSNYKILFINLGYARGISGHLSEHIRYGHRHFYCPPAVQRQSLRRLGELIEEESPDLCCFVEIDQGALGTPTLNQLDMVRSEKYPFFDIENKYAPQSFLRSFAFTSGKSNAFMSKSKYDFVKLFFTSGTKRLIYKIMLNNITIFFAHFSLKKAIRAQQILEARELMRQVTGDVIFLGDFNILSGLHEIEPLLDKGRFVLLNQTDVPTFFFHKRKTVLDLCICSSHINKNALLKVLPQAYTDHAALILNISTTK